MSYKIAGVQYRENENCPGNTSPATSTFAFLFVGSTRGGLALISGGRKVHTPSNYVSTRSHP